MSSHKPFSYIWWHWDGSPSHLTDNTVFLNRREIACYLIYQFYQLNSPLPDLQIFKISDLVFHAIHYSLFTIYYSLYSFIILSIIGLNGFGLWLMNSLYSVRKVMRRSRSTFPSTIKGLCRWAETYLISALSDDDWDKRSNSSFSFLLNFKITLPNRSENGYAQNKVFEIGNKQMLEYFNSIDDKPRYFSDGRIFSISARRLGRFSVTASHKIL